MAPRGGRGLAKPRLSAGRCLVRLGAVYCRTFLVSFLTHTLFLVSFVIETVW